MYFSILLPEEVLILLVVPRLILSIFVSTLGLNEQEVLKNVSGVLLTVPIGDYENPFNALNGKIFGWEIFAQFKFWPK